MGEVREVGEAGGGRRQMEAEGRGRLGWWGRLGEAGGGRSCPWKSSLTLSHSECHLQRQTPRRAFRLGLLKPSVHTNRWLEHTPASFWGMLAFLHTLTKGDPFIERGGQRGGQPAEAPSLRSRCMPASIRLLSENSFSPCVHAMPSDGQVLNQGET